MTVLDTFYLLFETKGTKESITDLDKLDQRISDLAKKGKKRSEEETKELASLRKQRTSVIQDIKDQTKQTDILGDSYVKLGLSIGTVVVGLLGLESIKGFANKVGETEKFQLSVKLLSDYIGTSAQNLVGFDKAFQAFGGNAGEGIAAIKTIHDYLVEQRFPASQANIIKFFEQLSKTFKQVGIDQAEIQGKAIGLTDNQILFLYETPEDQINKSIELLGKLSGTTADAGKAAQEFQEQWTQAADFVEGKFTGLSTAITKFLTQQLTLINDLFQGDFSKFFTDWKDSLYKETPSGGDIQNRPSAGNGIGQSISRSQQAIDYFVGQGYTPAQAQGIAANAQAESQYGNDPRTNAGSHSGVFQWSSANRQEIYNGTGIDVRNADYQHQLEAFNWYINKHGYDKGLKQQSDAGSAAAYIDSNVEKPYRGDALLIENQKRARIAIGLSQQSLNDASSSPLNSAGQSSVSNSAQSINVQIAAVNVQTQATDASGISNAIGSSLKTQINNTLSNFDDGVLA